MLPTVPHKYLEIYSLIIEQRQISAVLTIQRYYKKRGLERWLVSQDINNYDW